MDHDDEYDEHLERVETAATPKVAAREAGGGLFFLVLPLVAIWLARGMFALAGALVLRGTSQLAAVVVLVVVAARVGYQRGRTRALRRANPEIPWDWVPPPVVSWKTVRALFYRLPVTVLATIGLAHVGPDQFAPWSVWCATGAVVLVADLVVARSNISRLRRIDPVESRPRRRAADRGGVRHGGGRLVRCWGGAEDTPRWWGVLAGYTRSPIRSTVSWESVWRICSAARSRPRHRPSAC
jgi:hypothetical protein